MPNNQESASAPISSPGDDIRGRYQAANEQWREAIRPGSTVSPQEVGRRREIVDKLSVAYLEAAGIFGPPEQPGSEQ